ncbi:MAG: hypothetical protein ABI889_03965 [Gemmatimonadota bacterium]
MSTHLHAALVLVAIGASWAQAQGVPFALQRLTVLDAKARGAIERGDAVSVTIDASEKTAIATLGVVRLDVPRAFYVERVKQRNGLLSSGMDQQSGIFSEPARLEDVAMISLDPSDAKALQKCQPFKCDLKLPGQAMEHFRVALANTHDPLPRADSLLREWMVAYVSAYRGDSAEELVVYDDTKRPVRGGDALRALLAEPMPEGLEAEPFLSMLALPRSSRPRSLASRIVWEVDRMPGLKPTLEIVERSILGWDAHSDQSWMTTKLLYATHYFESQVEYVTVIDAPSDSGQPASYLIVLRRQKFDDLPSGGLFNIRGKAVKRIREALRATLTTTRNDVGAAYAASQSAQPHAPRAARRARRYLRSHDRTPQALRILHAARHAALDCCGYGVRVRGAPSWREVRGIRAHRLRARIIALQ